MVVPPVTPNPKNMTPEARKKAQAMLYMTGFFFAIVGIFILAMPDMPTEWFGFDKQTTQILGGALGFTGLMDIALARFLFNTQERK